jgi:hypothetical protein
MRSTHAFASLSQCFDEGAFTLCGIDVTKYKVLLAIVLCFALLSHTTRLLYCRCWESNPVHTSAQGGRLYQHRYY